MAVGRTGWLLGLFALLSCGESEPGEGENQAPEISIISPASGVTLGQGSPIHVAAEASDVDGTVVEVEFFQGSGSIGLDDTAPYTIAWSPGTGEHVLTARATDDEGATGTSTGITVTIIPGGGPDTQAPIIALTAPQDQAFGLTGAIQVTATASDNVGVSGVQFQLDGIDLGLEDTSSPYAAILSATADYTSGQHVFRTRARDAAGNLSPWAVATVQFGGSTDLPAGFTRSAIVPALPSLATTMAFAPDGRLFVCLQNGAVLVIKDGSLLPAPFVTVATSAAGERGLLGIAFHPNFATNGWVYLYYTTAQAGTHNRISRFTADGDTAATGETVIVDLPSLSSATNHNGGALHFGPDGKLYVAVGDNNSGNNAQDMSIVFGKMLRLNEDGSIPGDNPFLSTTTGLNQAIWALGLRNPYTFGFQPGTGRMFINDVGESTWEEINEGVAGANYGWPDTEGPTAHPDVLSPVYAYRHGTGFVQGIAIVGSVFYNPAIQNFPAEYVGQYFFADYAGGWIHRLDPDSGAGVSRFATVSGPQTDLRVGPDGAVYTLARLGGVWGVYRIAYGP